MNADAGRRRLARLLVASGVLVACAAPRGAATAVPSRFVAQLDMLNSRQGVGLTTTVVERCVPASTGGCDTVSAPHPMNVVLTTDGGRTWRVTGTVPTESEKSGISARIAFADLHRGYVAVDGHLLSTVNGGRTWRTVPAAGSVPLLRQAGATVWIVVSECPGDQSTGAACPTGLMTAAAGDTHPGPARTVPVQGIDLLGTPTDDVAVFDDSAQLVATFDRGDSWVRLADPCGPSDASALAGVDSHNWWLLCAEDRGMDQGPVRILETTDAGRSWRTVSDNGDVAVTQDLAISPDGGRLWLIGLNGVTTSTDGGRHWSAVAGVDGEGAFASVSTVSAEQAWLAAPDIGMWTTADGEHWLPLGPIGLPK